MPSEVPEGWRRTTLKPLLSEGIRNGYSPRCPDTPNGRWILALGALGEHGLDPGEIKPAPPDDEKVEDFILTPGDFLVSRSNTIDRVGRAAMYRGELDNCSYPDLMMRFRVKESVTHPHFFEQYLRSEKPLRYIRGAAAGTSGSMVKINQGTLEKLPVLLPPLPEQKKIAAILSSVDEAIQATQAVIDQTRRVKKGLLQDLLTRGIGHSRFKQTKLGELPTTWTVRPADEVCEAVIDCKNRTPPETESGFAVVRTPNVRDGRFIADGLKFTDDESYDIWTQRGRPQAGDVLITREAPVGEVALLPSEIVPACLGQRMMMYRPDPAKLNNEFMLAALLAPAVQNRLFLLAGGSTVGHVRVGDIRTLAIPVPPLHEQEQIARIMRSVGNVEHQQEEELAELLQVKAGLLQDLLTGKVRVSV